MAQHCPSLHLFPASLGIPSMRTGTQLPLEGALTSGKILKNHNFFHYITGRREEQPRSQAGRAQGHSEPTLKVGTGGTPSQLLRDGCVFQYRPTSSATTDSILSCAWPGRGYLILPSPFLAQINLKHAQNAPKHSQGLG